MEKSELMEPKTYSTLLKALEYIASTEYFSLAADTADVVATELYYDGDKKECNRLRNRASWYRKQVKQPTGHRHV